MLKTERYRFKHRWFVINAIDEIVIFCSGVTKSLADFTSRKPKSFELAER